MKEEKKFECYVLLGSRKYGRKPRYVSHVDLDNGDLIIRLCDSPVAISHELANAIKPIVASCSNLKVKYFEVGVRSISFFDSDEGADQHET